jgi:hypothetical protein
MHRNLPYLHSYKTGAIPCRRAKRKADEQRAYVNSKVGRTQRRIAADKRLAEYAAEKRLAE